MLRTAPSKADRAIVNIIGDGVDNMGEGPRVMRDELVAGDITIDGIIIGNDPVAIEYFRQHVIGGPTAFVLAVDNREKLVEVFARKFVTEIVLNIERTNQDHR